MKYFIMLCIGLFTTSTFAQEALMEPQSFIEALLLAIQTKGAVDTKSYAVALVGALMLLTFGIKKLFINSEKKEEFLPMITAIIGAMTGAGATIATGQGDLMTGALGGMLLGNSASGFYDAAVKPIKKRIKAIDPK